MSGTRVMTLGKATQPMSGCDCSGLRGVPANPRKVKTGEVKKSGAKKKTRHCIKVGKVTTRCFTSKKAAETALKKRNSSGRARGKARLVTKK